MSSFFHMLSIWLVHIFGVDPIFVDYQPSGPVPPESESSETAHPIPPPIFHISNGF
jgi:hypothetical protein